MALLQASPEAMNVTGDLDVGGTVTLGGITIDQIPNYVTSSGGGVIFNFDEGSVPTTFHGFDGAQKIRLEDDENIQMTGSR